MNKVLEENENEKSRNNVPKKIIQIRKIMGYCWDVADYRFRQIVQQVSADPTHYVAVKKAKNTLQDANVAATKYKY